MANKTTTPKRLAIIIVVTAVTVSGIIFGGTWLLINYPEFYCPSGTYRSLVLGTDKFQCSPDNPMTRSMNNPG